MKDTLIARTSSPRRQPSTVLAPHRTTHGSCAWSLPSRNETLRQPQDGAAAAASLRSIDGRALSNPLVEAEDARLSGTLRSLARRVKGLNFIAARPADTLLRADTYPADYFAEPPIAAFSPIPTPQRSELQRSESPRSASDLIRPRTSKAAPKPAPRLAPQAQVA